MPRVRPTVALHNLGRNPAALDSKRVSTCKLCGLGIFYDSAPYRWLRKPLGYSHDGCAEREGLL